MTVTVLNPLPEALRHYETALTATLVGHGVPVAIRTAANVEVRQQRRGRAGVLASALLERALMECQTRTIVLWPAFGYLDLVAWRRLADPYVVFHDPSPLRRQFGLGSSSSSIARRVAAGGPRIIAHSARATDELARRGMDRVTTLPLPMLTPRASAHSQDTVLVLGQYKAARDVDLLLRLAGPLQSTGWNLAIMGRGWPPVAGWNVVDRYLSENEFQQALVSAACVLLPYRKLYQSDVAVRAAELSIPVVGTEDSNVRDLFGSDWPGLVSATAPESAWQVAIESVSTLDRSEVLARVDSYHQSSGNAWAAWAQQ